MCRLSASAKVCHRLSVRRPACGMRRVDASSTSSSILGVEGVYYDDYNYYYYYYYCDYYYYYLQRPA